MEPGGETSNALIPMNVNTQSTRQRIWDGHDYYYRDDLSLLHGNHFSLVRRPGKPQLPLPYTKRQRLNHRREHDVRDEQDEHQLLRASCPHLRHGHFGKLPAERPSRELREEYVDDLGIVSLPQVLLTRAGSNLAIQPAGTPAFDQVTIMTYDTYFSDSWHIKPSITLTYGLNYGIQMPPSRSERQASFAGRFKWKPNQRRVLPEQSV